jgi:hypothetical protein
MRPRLPLLLLLLDVLGLTLVIPARLLCRALGARRWR